VFGVLDCLFDSCLVVVVARCILWVFGVFGVVRCHVLCLLVCVGLVVGVSGGSLRLYFLGVVVA